MEPGAGALNSGGAGTLDSGKSQNGATILRSNTYHLEESHDLWEALVFGHEVTGAVAPGNFAHR